MILILLPQNSLTGALASTAVIGVTKNNPPTSGSSVEVAVSDAGYTGGITSNDAAKFVSDKAIYKISYDIQLYIRTLYHISK